MCEMDHPTQPKEKHAAHEILKQIGANFDWTFRSWEKDLMIIVDYLTDSFEGCTTPDNVFSSESNNLQGRFNSTE